MNTRALALPAYIAEMVRLPLLRLGLDPSSGEEDVIICPLSYEDGTELSLVILYVAKRGWFREKPMMLISVTELDQNGDTTRVHFKDLIAAPTSPSDLMFTHNLSAKVRAMGWALAVTEGMGECISLPVRPAVAL